MPGFSVNGTPADCIKIATGVLMDHTPDLILSGINHGANTSVSSLYSGTLSAAREGAIQNIPAIGFSLCNFSHEADMSACREVARTIIGSALREGLKPGELLNVNIPDLPSDQIKGYKITRVAKGRWIEEFDERVDPHGRKYYWLTGRYDLQDEGTDTDEHVLAEGYVSVTPMTHDLTDYAQLDSIKSWSLS